MNMHYSVFELPLLRIVKFAHGVWQFIAALSREIYFAAFIWDGINSVIKGGNELPHSMCEFHNSQKMKFEN